MLLLRDRALWELLDDWLCGLPGAAFEETLPMLRRAFAQFPWPERRQMGERVRAGRSAPGPAAVAATDAWDEDRVRQILPVLAAVLGTGSGVSGG